MKETMVVQLIKPAYLWFWEAEVIQPDPSGLYPIGTILVLHRLELIPQGSDFECFEGAIVEIPAGTYKVKNIRVILPKTEVCKSQFQVFLEGLLVFLLILVVVFLMQHCVGRT